MTLHWTSPPRALALGVAALLPTLILVSASVAHAQSGLPQVCVPHNGAIVCIGRDGTGHLLAPVPLQDVSIDLSAVLRRARPDLPVGGEIESETDLELRPNGTFLLSTEGGALVTGTWLTRAAKARKIRVDLLPSAESLLPLLAGPGGTPPNGLPSDGLAEWIRDEARPKLRVKLERKRQRVSILSDSYVEFLKASLSAKLVLRNPRRDQKRRVTLLKARAVDMWFNFCAARHTLDDSFVPPPLVDEPVPDYTTCRRTVSPPD